MDYKIGEVIYKDSDIIINEGREVTEIVVTNLGDRSIQVASHFHFFESNLALKFDREKAFGKRLDIPSGTAARFEPGEERKVGLVEYAGNRKAFGFKGVTMGAIDDPQVKEKALAKMKELEEKYVGRCK